MIGVFAAVWLSGCAPSFALAHQIKLADVVMVPEQIKLDARLGTPFVLADRPNRAYIKVGLEGVETKNQQQRPPANIAIVLDRSSSMSGNKIVEAKRAATLAVRALSAKDVVSIVTYDSVVEVVVPATPVANAEAIVAAIANIQPRGSTALFAGVSIGAAELRKHIDPQRVNRVVLLSDGMANVGPSSPGDLADLGRSLAKEGISVSTLGLGLGYHEDLMMQLALASDGNHAFVENAAELARIFEQELGDLLSVVAQDVDVEIRLADGVKPVRVLGRDAEINGQVVRTHLNQVVRGTEKLVLLEVEIPPTAAGRLRGVAEISVSYADMGGKTRGKSAPGLVTRTVAVRGTRSVAKVEKETVSEVIVQAVELVANEQSKLALTLRDQGKVQEARRVLRNNEGYLRKENKKLRSKRLKVLEKQNVMNADAIDDERNWNRQRKQMVDEVFEAETQQSY